MPELSGPPRPARPAEAPEARARGELAVLLGALRPGALAEAGVPQPLQARLRSALAELEDFLLASGR